MSLSYEELANKELEQILKEAYFRELVTPSSDKPLWERVAYDVREYMSYWSCGCM